MISTDTADDVIRIVEETPLTYRQQYRLYQRLSKVKGNASFKKSMWLILKRFEERFPDITGKGKSW